jgi:hypothetical protein
VHRDEHTMINELLTEHALSTARTAEDELAASWRRHVDRLRHEAPALRPVARRARDAVWS